MYSNYISNYAWFGYEKYSSKKIIDFIYKYNQVKTNENNYMRENFADTFFSADDCSKIGYIREDIEKKYIPVFDSCTYKNPSKILIYSALFEGLFA